MLCAHSPVYTFISSLFAMQQKIGQIYDLSAAFPIVIFLLFYFFVNCYMILFDILFRIMCLNEEIYKQMLLACNSVHSFLSSRLLFLCCHRFEHQIKITKHFLKKRIKGKKELCVVLYICVSVNCGRDEYQFLLPLLLHCVRSIFALLC